MGFNAHRLMYVETDLSQVYNEGEQLSFSWSFQRTVEAQQRDPTRCNTLDPLAHSLHTHQHRLPSSLKEANGKTSNYFWTYVPSLGTATALLGCQSKADRQKK